MALEQHFDYLKSIKGFLAAGIMQFTGELLASHTVTDSIDLGIAGATFNDIFRSAHEVCTKIGLEAANELVLLTPKGIIVMLCTGVESKAHVHMITVLAKDGNQALAKMTMEKLAPAIVSDLA